MVIFCVAALFLTTCDNSGSVNKPVKGGTRTSEAANGVYAALWTKVSEFNEKGLPKSALEIVSQIYARAKKENNSGEFIKAIIHKIYYIQQVEKVMERGLISSGKYEELLLSAYRSDLVYGDEAGGGEVLD